MKYSTKHLTKKTQAITKRKDFKPTGDPVPPTPDEIENTLTSFYQPQSNKHSFISDTGIDTVRLHTEQFTFNRETLSERVENTNLIKDVQETDTKTGSLLKHFTRINSIPSCRYVTVHTAPNPRLRLQITLPKVLRDTNTRPVQTPTEAYEALKTLEQTLSEYGIQTNILNAQVSRLDLNQTHILPRSISNYAEVLRRLKFPRMECTQYDNDNILFSNTLHEIDIYNKGAQENADDLIRMEYRMLNAKKVVPKTRVTHAGHLITRFDSLKETYRNVMTELLTSLPTKKHTKTYKTTRTGTFKNVLKEMIDAGETAPYKKALLTLMLSDLSPGEVDEIKSIVSDEISPQTAYHFKQQTLQKLSPYTDIVRDKQLHEPLQELKDAFLRSKNAQP